MKISLTFGAAQTPLVENMLVANNVKTYSKPVELPKGKRAINADDVPGATAIAVSGIVRYVNNEIGDQRAAIGFFCEPD